MGMTSNMSFMSMLLNELNKLAILTIVYLISTACTDFEIWHMFCTAKLVDRITCSCLRVEVYPCSQPHCVPSTMNRWF